MNAEQQITSLGLVREPPLDGVDHGRLPGRHVPAVAPPLGGVDRRDERDAPQRLQRVAGPRGEPVVAVDDVGPPVAELGRRAGRSGGSPRPSGRRCRRSGIQGRSVRARSTRTPSTTASSGASGGADVSTTTSWPARARARPGRRRAPRCPPTTSGGYSQDNISDTHAGRT